MIKHEKFNEVQDCIGRVPRMGEFIQLLDTLGKGAICEKWQNLSACQKLEVPNDRGTWTQNYRALKYQGKLICVYQKGSNEDHYFVARTIRRVLGLK